MNEPIKVYELKEVASILKINLRVLRRYIKEEKIKASKDENIERFYSD